MKIILAFDDVADPKAPDVQDTLAEVDLVEKSLLQMGHTVIRLPFCSDLEQVKEKIQNEKPDLIFNLVESILGSGQLSIIATHLFDALSVPYTGNHSFAHGLSADKLAAKNFYILSGIPTPLGYTLQSADKAVLHIPYIIKATGEHASIGLSQNSVIVPNSADELNNILRQKQTTGLSFFAEEYIPGREFNVAILGDQILPPAEMLFSDKYQGWNILTYEAKWDENAGAYQESNRSFDFEPHIRQQLCDLALSVKEKLDLRGYTRIDFRLSQDEKLYVIDLNTNPCIAADSGFMAMANQVRLSPQQVIERIVADANFSF